MRHGPGCCCLGGLRRSRGLRWAQKRRLQRLRRAQSRARIEGKGWQRGRPDLVRLVLLRGTRALLTVHHDRSRPPTRRPREGGRRGGRSRSRGEDEGRIGQRKGTRRHLGARERHLLRRQFVHGSGHHVGHVEGVDGRGLDKHVRTSSGRHGSKAALRHQK